MLLSQHNLLKRLEVSIVTMKHCEVYKVHWWFS
jgi:hypothetical protein